MKSRNKIFLLSLVFGIGVIYYFLIQNQKTNYPELISDNYSNEKEINPMTLTLVIEFDTLLPIQYYPHLELKGVIFDCFKADTNSNFLYIPFKNLPSGNFRFALISDFHTAFDSLINLSQTDTISLRNLHFKSFDDSTTSPSQILKALKNKSPIQLVFRELGCFSSSPSTQYNINQAKNDYSKIYRSQHRKIKDSMSIDYAEFEKKLKKLISMKENPEYQKRKTYTDENGIELIEITYTSSTNNTYLDIQVGDNIYSISTWDFDLEGKQYEKFVDFCESFFQPQFQMKI